ncbi:helix-turn-helix domain-containing protein [Halomicroarcula sp. F13]|uniref:Helix-turn-helix domain-containing protein n=2 Tax=Haloarcula rubra TaxID=2487747 RepID=A0AAW4PZD9_9EURY|nr:helix-turn-helix domain-containing protein [Halomicroarcula rubra]
METRPEDGDGPGNGEWEREEWDLPPDSFLDLEEYLEMQKAISDPARYRIVVYLTDHDEVTPSELYEQVGMGLDKSTIHYHLDKLVDVGLVEKRARNDGNGIHCYYRITTFGKTILEHGVRELIRREWETRGAYNSDAN